MNVTRNKFLAVELPMRFVGRIYFYFATVEFSSIMMKTALCATSGKHEAKVILALTIMIGRKPTPTQFQ